jgi:hypothetical protein
MLESRELWLHRQSADDAASWTIGKSAREQLGQARWQPRPPSGWRRWLWRPSLEVVETEDESLLFTVHRLWNWSPAWEVRDAEGHPLGRIHGHGLFDMLGRRLAERSVDGTCVQSTDGLLLASLHPSDGGTCLAFGEMADENPFFKMLLLAVVLVGPMT